LLEIGGLAIVSLIGLIILWRLWTGHRETHAERAYLGQPVRNT
jgi:hypothetical protein